MQDIQEIRGSREYRQWKRSVKQRDRNSCRVCSETVNLHAHHIRPLEQYPDFATELDNGITLCGNCHTRLRGKEESTNLRTIIPDTLTADQLRRLNGKFCDYLLSKLDDPDERNKVALQLFGQLQIYPDSLDQFLPLIQHFLNRENGADQGLAEQMIVEFLKDNSSGAASQVVREYQEQIEAEKHRRDAEPEEVKELRRLAEQGDGVAQWYIFGWHYANGRDVIQNDEKAVKWYRRAAEQEHAVAQYDLGWMYQQGRGVSQDSGEAVRWFRKAARQGYADAQNNLGWRYQYGRGVVQNYAEAVKWYHKAAEQGHNDAQSRLDELQGRGVVQNNGVSNIELVPNDAVAYFNSGLAYRRQGDNDRAIADHTKAIEIKPDYAAAYNGRGWAYCYKGDYEKAIADFTKAIEIKPDFTYAYFNRGVTYGLKGEFDCAIADYTKVIELKPDYAEAHYNRGQAYGLKGEYDREIADCTKVIELKPDYTVAYKGRGIAYQKKGDFARADADFAKARELLNEQE